MSEQKKRGEASFSSQSVLLIIGVLVLVIIGFSVTMQGQQIQTSLVSPRDDSSPGNMNSPGTNSNSSGGSEGGEGSSSSFRFSSSRESAPVNTSVSLKAVYLQGNAPSGSTYTVTIRDTITGETVGTSCTGVMPMDGSAVICERDFSASAAGTRSFAVEASVAQPAATDVIRNESIPPVHFEYSDKVFVSWYTSTAPKPSGTNPLQEVLK